MKKQLSDAVLDQLFREARTYNGWQDKEVPDALLETLFDLTKMPPTAANCQPIRLVFVKSKKAKEKLKPCLMEGNVDKTMAAPVTAIIAYDKEFYEELPRLFPHTDARSWYVGKPKMIEETAFRNGSLQGAYLMLAARALGLDVGPMSGFNAKKLDETFFSGSSYRSNFLCNLGYGDENSLHSRSPRPRFDEFCHIA